MKEKETKRTYKHPYMESMKISCADILNSSGEGKKDDNQGPWDLQQELNIWNDW